MNVRYLRRLISLLRKSANHLEKLQGRFSNNSKGNLRGKEKSLFSHEDTVITSTKYDMVKEIDEPYYAKQYFHWILKAIKSEALPSDSICLDLGCGQGRLSFPLAKHFKTGKVFGVDFSSTAIETAKKYLLEEGLKNVEFSITPIEIAICDYKTDSFNVIIMNEVTFYYPAWRDLMENIKSILKPNGILFISFRSLYFNALILTKHKLLKNIDLLLNERTGNVFNDPTGFTWNKSSEIMDIITSEIGMDLLDLVGIGCCSGIEGDPHASVIRPSLLSDEDQNSLMNLEISLGPELPDAGRYMLAIAKKK